MNCHIGIKIKGELWIHQAIDFRKPIHWGDQHIPLNDFVGKLSKELGNDFDVVLESDHIHIEYDPKD